MLMGRNRGQDQVGTKEPILTMQNRFLTRREPLGLNLDAVFKDAFFFAIDGIHDTSRRFVAGHEIARLEQT